MPYLPTLRLNFGAGASNTYRIHEDHLEFRVNGGAWRILEGDEVQLHFLLHTEVSKWLLKFKAGMNPHMRDTGL